ncbi:MAG: hypothetical protein V7K94_08735, partial [Nostoc sp.]|uniref:hypothetical protein n=1 Tax=Nostoc sp. TaxID=1180 RepID=UPI002FF743F8
KRSGVSFVILKYSDSFSLNALRISGFCLSRKAEGRRQEFQLEYCFLHSAFLDKIRIFSLT